AALIHQRVIGCTQPARDQLSYFFQLADVVASVRHRERDAVGDVDNLNVLFRLRRNLRQRIAQPLFRRFHKSRMVEEHAQLVDLRRAWPTALWARTMSSRYCRHPEYELYAEVTNARARRTSSCFICCKVSASMGCQLRLPQYTGNFGPCCTSSLSRAAINSRVCW